ncbi:hypothetical protein, partial [Chitinophaga pinensis]|uniref:hypothetical protein n=1 Tax=Chitinophaga pinensis TaxID=79329 RepID=UPI001C999C5E
MMQHKVLTAESYNELLKKQVSVPRKHEFNANEEPVRGIGYRYPEDKNSNRYVHGGNNGDFSQAVSFICS